MHKTFVVQRGGICYMIIAIINYFMQVTMNHTEKKGLQIDMLKVYIEFVAQKYLV